MRMDKGYNGKWKRHLCRVLAAFFFAVPCVAYLDMNADTGVNIAEAKKSSVTPEQERYNAHKWVKEYNNMIRPGCGSLKVDQNVPWLKQIEDWLIAANPDKLNYNDGKHDRWLEPAYFTPGEYGNANVYSNGGDIIYTDGEYRLASNRGMEDESFDPDKWTARETYELNTNSNIAADLAHECSHFIHRDSTVKLSPKESCAIELRADIEGMQLMDKVPRYSMGSMITMEKRSYIRGNKQDENYPTSEERLDNEIAYLEKISGGRVKLDRNLRLTLDGKLLFGTGYMPDSEDATHMERTAYLAGQIASCIQRGTWSPDNVYITKEKEFAGSEQGRQDKTVLVVATDKTGRAIDKVLGIMDYDSDKPKTELTTEEKEELKIVRFFEAR